MVVSCYIHLDGKETKQSSIGLNVKTADSFMRSSIAKLAFYHGVAPHLHSKERIRTVSDEWIGGIDATSEAQPLYDRGANALNYYSSDYLILNPES